MSDKEIVKFSLKFSGVWWDKKPAAKIYVNEDLIADTVIDKEYNKESQTIEFTRELSEGTHTLVIDFYNKDNTDTVHENNVILKDMILSVDEIIIDDIELGYLALQLGKFYVNKSIRPEQPDVLEEIPLVFGFPGRWELKFTCPTYIWFLENL